MKILFLNGSPNPNGNTVALAETLLAGHDYEALNLVDYQINVYGQNIHGDQFDIVLEKVFSADILVIGSPLYWHNICGSVRTFLDRCYGPVEPGSLNGKLFFLFQGASPEKWMMEAGEFTIARFGALYGLSYQGMATNRKEAAALAAKL
jgi:multimeric flavodoxin WrbA